MKRRSHSHPRPETRDGMVLLLVLFILTMATATATFAVQTTGYEIRAAGTMRTGLRARNYADNFALAYMLTDPCAIKSVDSGTALPDLTKYGYPARAPTDDTYMNRVLRTEIEAYKGFSGDPVVDDYTLADIVAPKDANGDPLVLSDVWAMVECRDLPVDAGSASALGSGSAPPTVPQRALMTSFGELGYTAEASDPAVRGRHSAISISRLIQDK